MAAPLPPGQSGTRPLGRRANRVFVVVLMVLSILLAVGGVYLIYRSANDPDVQQRIREVQRLEAERNACM
jgi:hypothetical protein